MTPPKRVPEVRRERATFTVEGTNLDVIRQLVIDRLHEIDSFAAWIVHDMHLTSRGTMTGWFCEVEAEARDPREERTAPRRWFPLTIRGAR